MPKYSNPFDPVQHGRRRGRSATLHRLTSLVVSPIGRPELKRAVLEQQRLFGATVVLIEDQASGTQLIQDLIADRCYGVTRCKTTGEKTMRMHAQTDLIENGFVHIPETAPWLAEYLHELAVFPNGKHDDQADSTAQFLDWFRRPCPASRFIETMRLVERLRKT